MEQVKALREQLSAVKSKGGEAGQAAAALDDKVAALEGKIPPRFGGGGRAPWTGAETLNRVSGSLRTLMMMLQEADVAPTTQALTAAIEEKKKFSVVMQQWQAVQSTDVPKLNTELKSAGLPPITVQ